MAVGSTQIELKSRVAPPTVYISRGVDAMEIIPQQASKRNSTTSPTRQSVRAALTPMTTSVAAMTAATYQRSIGGSRHQAHSLTASPRLRRAVTGETFMIHRSGRDAC